MESITSILARALTRPGGSPSQKETVNMENLPDPLKKLADAINNKTKAEKANEDSESRRQEEINRIQTKFIGQQQELAAVISQLQRAQVGALEQAEKNARLEERRIRRDEAARKRAEKLASVSTRQTEERNQHGASLIGALFGQTLGDFTRNALAAKAQTKADIAELEDARYAARVEVAAETKEDAFEAAEDKRFKAVDQAALSYENDMFHTLMAQGKALAEAKKSAEELSEIERKAKSAGVTPREASVLKENEAKGTQVAPREAPVPKEKERSSGMPSAKEAAVASTVPAIEVTVPPMPAQKPEPLIVTPDGRDALEVTRIERERKPPKAAEKPTVAGQEVDLTETPYDVAKMGYRGNVGVALGDMVAGESLSGMLSNAVSNAMRIETEDKAKALNAETAEKAAAYDEKTSGFSVDPKEQKKIGRSNLMNMAVAHPALMIIAKVMDQFRGLFPVIEQTGNALIEMGTALPAVLVTAALEVQGGLTYALSEIRDAIWTPNVRKRYDKSNDEYLKEFGVERSDVYADLEEKALEETKKRATNIKLRESKKLLDETAAMPVASLPAEIASKNIEGVVTGTAHIAPSPIEGNTPITTVAPSPTPNPTKEFTTEVTVPAPKVESPRPEQEPDPARRNQRSYNLPFNNRQQPLGVVPVGASSYNVDRWW